MKGGQDHGQGKDKAVSTGNKKRFKSKDRKKNIMLWLQENFPLEEGLSKQVRQQ